MASGRPKGSGVLELGHLPVRVCLALLPLQACLLGPELPQLPPGSRQLLLQLGHGRAVPRERPPLSVAPGPASDPAHSLQPEPAPAHDLRVPSHPGPTLRGAQPLPAGVAGEGLLEAADVPLGLLDLALSL